MGLSRREVLKGMGAMVALVVLPTNKLIEIGQSGIRGSEAGFATRNLWVSASDVAAEALQILEDELVKGAWVIDGHR